MSNLGRTILSRDCAERGCAAYDSRVDTDCVYSYTHPAPEAKQGEPVATLTVRDDMGADIKFHRALTLLPGQTFALYAHPVIEAKQEPVAWSYESAKAFALQEANKLLDAALLKTYPQGCDNGEVFDLWNKARAAIAAAEQAPQPTSLTSLLKHKDVQAALLAAIRGQT